MIKKSEKNYVLFLIVLLVFLSCSTQVNLETEKQALIKTDSEFSNLSKEKGMNEAFLTYVAEDGVLLRRNSLPIKGKNVIREKLLSSPDTSVTLTWEPQYADVAKSGELGYTYGIYVIKGRDEKGNPASVKGTYCSIWKRDEKRNWKFVLDTGNAGLGEGK